MAIKLTPLTFRFLFSIPIILGAVQAVRFLQGDIGAPFVDMIISGIYELFPVTGSENSSSFPLREFFAEVHNVLYHLSGVVEWLMLAKIVQSITSALARPFVANDGWTTADSTAKQTSTDRSDYTNV
jgi:hypothetical protein